MVKTAAQTSTRTDDVRTEIGIVVVRHPCGTGSQPTNLETTKKPFTRQEPTRFACFKVVAQVLLVMLTQGT
jgi:hypothetical protein